MPYLETDGVREVSKSYDLKRLFGRHRQICRLHVLGGMDGQGIAQLMGVTPQTVYNVLGSELGVKLCEELSNGLDDEMREVQQRLQELSPIALDIVEETMLDEETPLPLKVKVADSILNRAGHNPAVKIEQRSTSLKIDADFIKEIKQRASELVVNDKKEAV